MAKIKKGDLVQVIAGADKGQQGRVLEVDTKRERVIVEGVARVTKHTKVGQTQRGGRTGGIETVESSIHISNVALVGKDKKPVRVGYKLGTEERNSRTKVTRVRVGRRGGKEVEL